MAGNKQSRAVIEHRPAKVGEEIERHEVGMAPLEYINASKLQVKKGER